MSVAVLGALSLLAAALPGGTAAAASPVISISPVTGTFYTNPCNNGTICLGGGSGATQLFPSQTFPVIDFDPPAGAVPCNPAASVSTVTQPFTDVVLNPDGTCTLIAADNGLQTSPGPGSGAYAAFQAAFTGTLTVTGGSATVTFDMFSDDGWVLGIGPDSNGKQPAYASGSMYFAGPRLTTTPLDGFQVVGAFDAPSGATENPVTVTFPEAGVYPFEADYDEFNGLPESFSMNANGSVIAHTNLTLTPMSQTATAGTAVTLTANLANANPQGTAVTFTVTGANPQTETVTADASGNATFTYTGAAVGTDSVTAAAAAFGGTVTSNTATVDWTAVGTATTVTSSANPSVVGQAVTYTATVVASPPSTGTPAGTVTFADNGTAICSNVPLSAGQAACAATYAAPADHTITATYSGGGIFLDSSGSLSQMVAQAATTLALASAASPITACDNDRDGNGDARAGTKGDVHQPECGGRGTVFGSVYGPDTSLLGQPVTFTATVAVVAPGAGTPTGTVTFTDGSTTLGTATLNASGTASITAADLPAGPQTITAAYGGDTDFLGSSASLTQRVEYRFIGLLPPFGRDMTVDANRTVPIAFTLLDAQGHVVRDATATLTVNGEPAVPQGKANTGDAFRLQGDRYMYLLKLRDQGVTSGTATLTISLSDGTTHTFTLNVRGDAEH